MQISLLSNACVEGETGRPTLDDCVLLPGEGLGPELEADEVGKADNALDAAEANEAGCNGQGGNNAHSESQLQNLHSMATPAELLLSRLVSRLKPSDDISQNS